VGHDRLVERGREGRSLSPRRDVAPPEIRHRRNAGSLGDDIRIADLSRRWPAAVGIMANRLAVTSHRGDPGRFRPRSRDGGQGRIGKEMSDLDIEPGDAGVGDPIGGRDFQQTPAQSGRNRMSVRVEQVDGVGSCVE